MISKKDKALRYLLVKHCWLLRRKCPPGIHSEVACSLRVESDGETIWIRWTNLSQAHSKQVPAETFSFYSRGDLPGSSPSSPTSNSNAERAHSIAAECLGLPPQVFQVGETRLFATPYIWPILLLGAGIAGYFLDSVLILPLFALISWVEILRWRSAMTYLIPGAVMLLFDPSGLVVVCFNLWLAFLCFMEGNMFKRGLLVGAHGLLAAGGLFLFLANSVPFDLTISSAIILVIALLCLAATFFCYESGRKTVLVAPILAISLAYSGFTSSSFSLLICDIVYLLFLSGYWTKPSNYQP